jgi:Alpha galactosidase A/Alpha galactosidase C-terminal beta sandwich domain/Carbohydrate binding module (family 6)/Carbohydrate binding module (family 35)
MRARLRQRLVAVLAASLVSVGIAVVATSSPAAATDNGLSVKPAMGWSSWSFIRRSPTDAKIRAQADAMVSSGLANHGYVYVNLDDFWQLCDSNGFVVDGFGRWVPDPAKFPSGIKALADYIHGLGLKFGFYVTPGIPKNAVLKNTPIEGTSYHATDIANTSLQEKNYNCRNMYFIDYSKPGAQPYVDSWARQFASWGVDYLKIDGVGSSDIPDVQAWATGLRNSGRPINYALSNNLPIADAATWQRLANSWRTQGDVECYCGPGPNGSGYPLTTWSRVTGRFSSAASWQPWAGPEGWNDLDSLEVGNGDQVGLTADQRRSTMTLWAMAASPLLLGTDLTNLTSTDIAMLTNDRLIAVDQDGYAASRIAGSGANQVWRKREDNGDFIVALFNTDASASSTVSVTWSQVGFSGSATVTDLWSGTSLGTISNSYSVTLRPGENRLLRVRPTSGAIVRYQAENATITPGTADNNHIGFTGTGFANTDNAAGSYVEWTVDAPAAGSYALRLRYANGGTTNRPTDLAVNGSPVGTGLPFAGTGSWDTWAITTATVNLTAGSNTIRVTASTAGGAPNLDYLELERQQPSTRYEAENGVCQGTVDSDHTGFSGTGFCNTTNAVGAYVEFAVTAPAARTFTLTFRYANGTTTNRPMDISVNGSTAGNLPFPGTGSWDTWANATVTVTLAAGTSTIRTTATTSNGGPNIDYLDVAG